MAGAGLVASPARSIDALFGTTIDGPQTEILCRMMGAALLAIAIAAWRSRDDGHVRAARGLVTGMVVYNGGAALTMAYAGLALRLAGFALWPGFLLHLVMTGWCAANVRPKKPR